MAAITWVQYNERVVGENSPLYADVDNRPLKEVFTASALTDVEDFPGFIPTYRGAGTPEGVQVSPPGRLFFRTDTGTLFIKATGTGLTGWIGIGSPSGTPTFFAKFNTAGTNVEAGIMKQAEAPDVVGVVIGTDPNPLAAETFRITGGMISAGTAANSTRLGPSASAINSGAIAIGDGAIGNGSDCIAIGTGAITNNIASAIAIGDGAEARAPNCIAIGTVATVPTLANESIVIGSGAIITATTSFGAAGASNAVILIGRNASLSGGTSVPVRGIFIGNGLTIPSSLSTCSNMLVIGTGITFLSATNQGAASLVMIGSGHTLGNAAGVGSGCVVIGAGISLLTAQVNAVLIGNVAFGGGAAVVAIGSGAGNINIAGTGGVYIGFDARGNGGDYQTVVGYQANIGTAAAAIIIGRGSTIASGVARIVLGELLTGNLDNTFMVGTTRLGAITACILGSAGDVATSASGNLVAVTWRPTDASGADTAGPVLTIQASRGTGNAATGGTIAMSTGDVAASSSTRQPVTVKFTVLQGNGIGPTIRFDNATTGAGVAAGTLLNAPAAGNPAFWLPVSIAGTTRYIPCW